MSYNVLSHSHWGLRQFWGGGGFVDILRGGGKVKKRQSPDFRSPEVGVSVTGKVFQISLQPDGQIHYSFLNGP